MDIITNELRPVPHVRKNGYDYNLVLYGAKAIIYEQRLSDGVVRYEVSELRIKRARTIKGKFIPAKVWFPYDEAIGQWAWTLMTYEKALWRYNELNAGKKQKNFTYPNTTKKIIGEDKNE